MNGLNLVLKTKKYIVLFAVILENKNEKFIKSGFDNWKKISEALKKHDKCEFHIQSILSHKIYKSSGDVQQQIHQQSTKQNLQSTEYVKKLIDIILLLVRQGLPLRAHREGIESKNRGNF